ncbi:MAG: Na+/H+ antiporter subunit E [Lachnospiraceae bacterium]|nr:Na+/H+ antiporter subunit E [Lachnospiraceae bacterium]
MFLLFLVIWIILNGRFTWEVLGIGLVLCVPLGVFFARFMDYSIRKEFRMLSKLSWAVRYVIILLREIIKANFQVLSLILSSKYEPEPVLMSFRTDIKKTSSRVILANSITLTPGTITVGLSEDGRFLVHALDREIAEGTEDSVFVHMLLEEQRSGADSGKAGGEA